MGGDEEMYAPVVCIGPLKGQLKGHSGTYCYNFSYFALFTYDFSFFLEVSHGAAALTHFSLTHITATLLTQIGRAHV